MSATGDTTYGPPLPRVPLGFAGQDALGGGLAHPLRSFTPTFAAPMTDRLMPIAPFRDSITVREYWNQLAKFCSSWAQVRVNVEPSARVQVKLAVDTG